MISVFIQYQALRWMFIDECRGASIAVLAEINHKTSTQIRQQGSWALRTTNIKRPFEVLNMATSGEA